MVSLLLLIFLIIQMDTVITSLFFYSLARNLINVNITQKPLLEYHLASHRQRARVAREASKDTQTGL